MSKNSIQVAIKVRPLFRKEKDQSLWRVINNSIHLIDSQSEPYYFDHIFDQDATNQIIFDKTAKHIVHSGVKGFNGTIFAYGQTSSGKTYTMMGDDHNPGVMVLAAKEIFKQIVNTTDRQFLLRVGYIEIYNEKIYDLLNKKNQDLKIHETTTGVVSVNCEEICITCEEDLLNLLCEGNKERTVGETNMNERSSRSHAIFRIIIESRKMDRSEDDAVIQSVLNLVDLAGSERANQTGARSTRLKEGGHINKSLLFLSNVIKRLSENEDDDKYIGYRDSKLTRILQASLGGNALTSIICTIKPTAVEESQSTLSFAMRAKTVKNKPQVNEIISDATMMKRLEGEIKQLKTCLVEERRKNESQIKVCQLEQRIKNEVLKIISSNSLHNIQTKRERRRRTWCPDSTNQPGTMQSSSHSGLYEVAAVVEAPLTISSRLLQPGKLCTPNITLRDHGEVKAEPKVDVVIEQDEEHFASEDLCPFEDLSPLKDANLQVADCKTPIVNDLRKISLTPNVASSTKQLEMVERALLELEEFTKLEAKLDVKHDTVDALKQKLLAVTERNAVLEGERLMYIEMKEELPIAESALIDSQRRCDEFQIQISKLANQYRIANAKAKQYDQDCAKLKQKISQLEMENRKAVSLEFEFEGLKMKSNLRETELLESLAEKEKQIADLDKALFTTKNKLQYSKENRLPILHSKTVQNSENNMCIRCKDLNWLVIENQLQLDFENLTDTKLKISNIQPNVNSLVAAGILPEVECEPNIDTADCANLRSEISELSSKLETVQLEYTQANCDRIAKEEECNELSNVVVTARMELNRLQEKYDQLEAAWQEQQQTVLNIQTEYDVIMGKYKCLQTKYEEVSLFESQEVYVRLQHENVTLQFEINELKTRLEHMHKTFQDNDRADIDSKDRSENLSRLQKENEKQTIELFQLRVQFDDLQKEYDDLSNQLIDTLQDGDILREHCRKLEVQLGVIKCIKEKPDGASSKLRPTDGEINKMRLCHVLTDEDETDSPLSMHFNSSSRVGNNTVSLPEALRFENMIETLQEIVLEQIGIRRKFVATTPPSPGTNESCKLFITSIDEVIQKEPNNVAVLIKGRIKYHTICIVDIAPTVLREQSMEDLKTQIIKLTTKNEFLGSENKLILDSTEKTIREMREQIEKLSSELFEKSLFVQQSSCTDYQKKKCLDEESVENAAKCVIDVVVGNSNGIEVEPQAQSVNTRKSETYGDTKVEQLEGIIADLNKKLDANIAELEANAVRIEYLQTKCENLQVRCASAENLQNDMLVLHERKLSDIEGKLSIATFNLQHSENKCRDERNRLQLELCEKLELNESVSREHLRKYREWEKSEERYENVIGKLQRDCAQLEAQATLCRCGVLHSENEIQFDQQKVTLLRNVTPLTKQSTSRTMKLDGTIGDYDENGDNRNQNIEYLNKLIVCLESEKSALVEKNQLTSIELQEANEKHVLKEKELIELRSQRSTYYNLENELDAQLDKMAKQENELKDLRQQLNDMADVARQCNELKELIKNLESNGRDLCKEKDQITVNLSEVIASKIALEKQVLELQEASTQTLSQLRQQILTFEALSREKKELSTSIDLLKSEYEQTIASLLAEVNLLQLALSDQKREQMEHEERETTLLSKLESLSDDLCKAKTDAESYQNLLCDFEEAKKSLLAANLEKSAVNAQLVGLQEALAKSLSNEKESTTLVQSQQMQIQTLTGRWKVAQNQILEFEKLEESLQHQIVCLKEKLENESSLQRQIQELNSSLTEFQLKYDSLLVSNAHLLKKNAELEHKLIAISDKAFDCEALRMELQTLRDENLNLQDRVDKNIITEKKDRLVLQNLSHLKQLYEENFDGIKKVFTLPGTKAMKTYDVQTKIDSCNLSFESSTSSSPHNRRSIDRVSGEADSLKSVNVNIEDKLSLRKKTKSSESQERRNRRLSTHDDRRHQSIWGATRDVGSMTDPPDSNCNCVKLDGKLKECERNLFIRESQVTALNFELKNHPLKEENAILKKRLQGEQENSTNEIKKYKQIIREQIEKAGNGAAPTHTNTNVKSKMSANVEVQTECDVDICLQKLQGKYSDLKNICRHRYNVIKDLQLKLALRNENTTVKVDDVGEIRMLKTQLDEAKK